jgi:hypothetical protein
MSFIKNDQLNRWLATRSLGLVVLLLALVSLKIELSKVWRKDHFKTIVNSDGKGYYAYLPNVFIYHDWSYSWYPAIESKYRGIVDGNVPFLNGIDQGLINKYNCGIAILLLPFFLLATIMAVLFQYPVDGYSEPFMIGVSIGCLFYTFVGLYALGKWLSVYVRSRSAAITVVAIYLGTQLFYYSLFEPSMVHAFTFSLVGMGLRLFQLSQQSMDYKVSVLFAFCCGLIFLVRPTSILFLIFIPIALSEWWNWFLGRLKSPLILAMIMAFIIPFLIQCYFNYLQIGKALVYAYGGETFNFLHPHIWEILFGFRVGLFIYSPVLFIALITLLVMLVQRKKMAIHALLFVIIYAYIISSWHAWHYEGTFGMRPFVDVLAVFALPLALAIDRLQRIAKFILISVLCVFIATTQVLSWCRLYSIIPWSGMTSDKYFVTLFHPYRELAYRFTPIDFPPFPSDPKDIQFGFIKERIDLKPYADSILYRWRGDSLQRQITFQCDVVLAHNRSNAKLILDEYSKGKCSSQSVLLGRAGAAQNERMWLQASFNFHPCDSIHLRFFNEHSANAEVSHLSWSEVKF